MVSEKEFLNFCHKECFTEKIVKIGVVTTYHKLKLRRLFLWRMNILPIQARTEKRSEDK